MLSLAHQSVLAADEAQALQRVSARLGLPLARLGVIARLPHPQPRSQAEVGRYIVAVREPGQALLSFRVSDDATAVWIAHIGGGALSLSWAQAHLELLAIRHGLVEGALARAVAAWQAGQPLPEEPLAQTAGRPARHSLLAPVAPLEGLLLRPGEVFARQVPAPPGHTVFGQPLVGRGKPTLAGPLLLRDDGGVVAQAHGTAQLSEEGGHLVLTPLLRLDAPKIRATLDVPARTLAGEAVTLSMLRAPLLAAGVLSRFVRDDLLATALAQATVTGQTVSDLLVAEGRPSIQGQDGRLELAVPPPLRLHEDEQGRIDVYELGTLVNVQSGERLATLLPPTAALRGEDLLGYSPTVRDGAPLRLVCGPGVSQSGDQLYATREGALSIRGSRIDVVPLYIVEGDVEPQLGNLNFMTGAILIRGSVKPRLTVRAAHQIVVEGDVDGGILLAGGDVLVRGTIVGGQVGRIESHGTVSASGLLHARVQAREDIVVRSEVSHSTVEAGGRLRVASAEGWLCGGQTRARGGVAVPRLGAPGLTPTRIFIGTSSPQIEERSQLLEKLEAELAAAEDQLRALGDAHLQRGASASPADRAQRQRLLENCASLRARRERAREQIRDLGKAMPPEEAMIRVSREMFPGVQVEVRGQVFPIWRPWGPDRIVYDMQRGCICLASNGGHLLALDPATAEHAA